MINTPWRNVPVNNHRLVGSAPRTYRDFAIAYDPDLPENRRGGTLVIGNGMPVGIKAVFYNWNAVPGLDMLYVYCFATGCHTHVTPFDLGLSPFDPDTGLGGEPFAWVEMTDPEVVDYLTGHLTFGHADAYTSPVQESADGNSLLVPDYLLAAHRTVTP